MKAEGAGKTGEFLGVSGPLVAPKSDEGGRRLGVKICRRLGVRPVCQNCQSVETKNMSLPLTDTFSDGKSKTQRERAGTDDSRKLPGAGSTPD